MQWKNNNVYHTIVKQKTNSVYFVQWKNNTVCHIIAYMRPNKVYHIFCLPGEKKILSNCVKKQC